VKFTAARAGHFEGLLRAVRAGRTVGRPCSSCTLKYRKRRKPPTKG